MPMSEQEVVSLSQAEQPSDNRNRRPWPVYVVLGAMLAIVLCCLGGVICVLVGVGSGPCRLPESSDFINEDDPFVAYISKQFCLPQVIQGYDQVINAIESYHRDHGVYPSALSALVPDYLPRVPSVRIKGGESLTYIPGRKREGDAPFTFSVDGHYPGLAFMHGWELKYCPKELGMCNELHDDHFHPHRINDRWIWISRSAL